MSSTPLLLACTSLYMGPWVPAADAEGVIRAEGLVVGEDEVVVHIRDVREEEPDTIITLQLDAEVKLGVKASLIRVERTLSSGHEVSVWLK